MNRIREGKENAIAANRARMDSFWTTHNMSEHITGHGPFEGQDGNALIESFIQANPRLCPKRVEEEARSLLRGMLAVTFAKEAGLFSGEKVRMMDAVSRLAWDAILPIDNIRSRFGDARPSFSQ